MIDTNAIRNNIKHGLFQYSNQDIIALCDEIDRLRGEKQTPQGKTVRVKVAVVVDNESCWSASGWTQATNEAAVDDANEYFEHDNVPRYVFWLTADLPVPEETTVEAEVYTATNDENATSGGRG